MAERLSHQEAAEVRQQVAADQAKINAEPFVGVAMIKAERSRQVAVEGYTPEHDAKHHAWGTLAEAGAAYALAAAGLPTDAADHWPFDEESFKGSARSIDSLAKAGALIAAEIDRLVAEEARRG